MYTRKTGDDYYDSEEFHQLLERYEQAKAHGEPVFLDAEELTDVADFYQMSGNDSQADEAIAMALSLAPDAVAPLTYKVHEEIFRGNTAGARTYLARVADKSDPEYTYCRAEILLAENRPEEADKYLREQMATVPVEEMQDYAYDVASICNEYGFNDLAMKWMARVKQDNSPDFKELLARTLFGLGKYKDSEKIFNELLDHDPYSRQYWNALASVQLMNEDYSAAIQSSEFAIAIDPDDCDALLAKANGLYRLTNYEEALKYYERYLAQIPDDEFALMYQGTCLVNLGRTDEAIEMLHRAINIADEDSVCLCDIYVELAFALSEKGETEEAMACIDEAEKMDHSHLQLPVIRGHLLLSADRMEEAEHYFSQAIIESDDPPQTLLRIIVSLYDNKYLESTYEMCHKYFDAVGDDATDGHAYMALCCYDLKRYDEFLSSRADMTNLPDSYREQMVDAYRMYIDTERRTHRGISSAVATRAEMDSTLSLMQVFVMLTFADSTQEEVVVPMVRRDGQWKMR